MKRIIERYAALFAADARAAQRAAALLPGGVSTDSRIMQPFPVHISHAAGAHKWSLGGSDLIDYWAGHGAILLGHNPPAVVNAVGEQIRKGTHYSACQTIEADWAQRVIDLIPSAERVRFAASGTEANLLALSLAQTYTGKPKLLRFVGHYHGWREPLITGSEMVAGSFVDDRVRVCAGHDLETVAQALANDSRIGCIILEPTGPSSGVVPIDGDFLYGLRELTRSYGVLLIFDEVVTGFRVSPGGAQGYCGVTPDLTTLAKLLAGGLPGGAVAGRADIMDCLTEEGARRIGRHKLTHMGTFSGNPLSAAAGVAALGHLSTGAPQRLAEHSALDLRRGLNEIIDRHGLDWAVYGESSMVKFLVGHGGATIPAADFKPGLVDPRILLRRGDANLFQALRLALLINGVDIAPSSFLTAAHSDADLDKTFAAFEDAIGLLRRDGLLP